MRKPGELVRRAVHTGAVGVAIRAVDVGRQRHGGGVDLAVLETRRRGSGHQVEETLIVPELRQRKVDDLFRTEGRARISLVGLEQRGFRLHGDRFGELADLQPGVHAADGTRRHRDLLQLELLEPLECHLHVVRARQDVGERVRARLVRDGRHHQVRLAVYDFNRGARNVGARPVLNRADDAAVELLGRRAVEARPPAVLSEIRATAYDRPN